MLELRLTNADAILENFNPRVEKDGPDKVPAADIKISTVMRADVLDACLPGVKERYFNENGPRDLADGPPLRDSHEVYPHKRNEEMTGATVRVGWGLGDPMTFLDSKVNALTLEPRDGGMFVVTLRVQCRPNEAQAGRLYMLQESAVTFSVEPAKLPELKAAA